MKEMQTTQAPQKAEVVKEEKPKGSGKSILWVLVVIGLLAITLIAGLVIGYAVGYNSSKSADEISLSKDTLEYIEYDFGDSSVPPKYHRSYKIRIMEDTISITVDSYGDILNEKSFPLAENDLNEIINAVKNIDFNKKYSENEGCTGGVTKALTLKTKTSEFKVDVYVCGGLSKNDMLELDAAAAVITSKIPDFEKELMRDME